MFQQHEWNFFRLYGNVELHFQLFNGYRFWFLGHFSPKIALTEKIISKSMILKAHVPLVYLEWNFLQLLPNPNEYQLTFQEFKYYPRESYLLKWGASLQWSFRPNSAWGSLETTITGKTHSTLVHIRLKPCLLIYITESLVQIIFQDLILLT